MLGKKAEDDEFIVDNQNNVLVPKIDREWDDICHNGNTPQNRRVKYSAHR